jgi:hypothetical protein
MNLFKNSKGRPSGLLVAFICLLVAAMGSVDLQAQDLRGQVAGTVTDASGAVIPGANVTLTNDNTTVATRTSTSAVG